MNKRDLQLLEQVFGAEVEGRLPYQSKSKQMVRLETEGYVQKMKTILPATSQCPWPVTITGWELTHLGRLTFCSTCSDENS